MNKNRQSGFTLVELIVVIAILGILAGVGTVAYTGYVEKANKAVDQQLVADIEYAMQLAYASDPQGFTGAASVVLDTTGSAVKGAEGSAAVGWVTEAMERAFGNDWATTLKLKYTKWGKGAETSNKVLTYFKGISDTDAIYGIVNGTAKPSFANDVDDLFYEIKDTAISISGDGNGAQLIVDAAKKTKDGTNANEFAGNWATQVWSSSMLMQGDASQYDNNNGSFSEEQKADSSFMGAAIANAGVLKARNTALASYLRENDVDEAVCKVFENYTYGNSRIPRDAVGVLLDPNNDATENNKLWKDINTAAYSTILAGGYKDSDEYDNYLNGLIDAYYGITWSGNTQISPTDITATKAYADGLAYYTMMQTVNEISKDQTNITDDTYWDEMQGAVGLYGSIARGEVGLDELNAALSGVGENQVAVVVKDDGSVIVNPMTAQAGN